MCSYRVRGFDGSCVKHLTVKPYTVVNFGTLLTVILIINTNNYSLSIVLTATDQKPQKSLKR